MKLSAKRFNELKRIKENLKPDYVKTLREKLHANEIKFGNFREGVLGRIFYGDSSVNQYAIDFRNQCELEYNSLVSEIELMWQNDPGLGFACVAFLVDEMNEDVFEIEPEPSQPQITELSEKEIAMNFIKSCSDDQLEELGLLKTMPVPKESLPEQFWKAVEDACARIKLQYSEEYTKRFYPEVEHLEKGLNIRRGKMFANVDPSQEILSE